MPSFWEKIRKDFPITRDSLYLDHAAGGPVSSLVRERTAELFKENALEADFAWPKWMDRVEAIRERVARFINAEPEEITFVQSTSQAMNAIADLISAEGKVLTNECEFPSSTLPWLWRANNLVFQKAESGRVSLETLKSNLSPDITTVLTSFVQYATGFRQDMTRLGKIKGRRYLVVNATQGFGSMRIDVKKWKADFLCTNSYKWLMAGYGGGVLYVRKKWIKKFKPAAIGWRSVRNADAMNNRNTKLLEGARRYEMGCPDFPAVFAVGAAVEYCERIGMERVEARVLKLSGYAADALEKAGYEVVSPREDDSRAGIVIVRMRNAKQIWKRLLGRKVFVTPRGEGLRVAPHFYNTYSEIDRFIQILKQRRTETDRAGREK